MRKATARSSAGSPRSRVKHRAIEEAPAPGRPFRTYFDLGLIGMAMTSPTKGILEVNDQLCEMLGYSRPELLQRTWAQLTHPDDLLTDIVNFERVVAGDIESYSIDKRFVHKDGRAIDTTISVKCVRRADGAIEHF